MASCRRSLFNGTGGLHFGHAAPGECPDGAEPVEFPGGVFWQANFVHVQLRVGCNDSTTHHVHLATEQLPLHHACFGTVAEYMLQDPLYTALLVFQLDGIAQSSHATESVIQRLPLVANLAKNALRLLEILVRVPQLLVQVIRISHHRQLLRAHHTDRAECGRQNRYAIQHPVSRMDTGALCACQELQTSNSRVPLCFLAAVDILPRILDSQIEIDLVQRVVDSCRAAVAVQLFVTPQDLCKLRRSQTQHTPNGLLKCRVWHRFVQLDGRPHVATMRSGHFFIEQPARLGCHLLVPVHGIRVVQIARTGQLVHSLVCQGHDVDFVVLADRVQPHAAQLVDELLVGERDCWCRRRVARCIHGPVVRAGLATHKLGVAQNVGHTMAQQRCCFQHADALAAPETTLGRCTFSAVGAQSSPLLFRLGLVVQLHVVPHAGQHLGQLSASLLVGQVLFQLHAVLVHLGLGKADNVVNIVKVFQLVGLAPCRGNFLQRGFRNLRCIRAGIQPVRIHQHFQRAALLVCRHLVLGHDR